MSELDVANTFYLTLIGELKEQMKRQMDSIGAIRDAGKTVFGATSVLLTLVAWLQLNAIKPLAGFELAWWTVMVLALLAFCFMIAFAFSIFSPVDFTGPVAADWKVIEAWSGISMDQFYANILGGYTEAIQKNREVIGRLSRKLIAIMILFVVVLVFILALSFMPRG